MIINSLDNVEVDLSTGHKKALIDIKKGNNIIKYGFPIGHAVCDIKMGERVHTDNLKTNLSEKLTYKYEPESDDLKTQKCERSFKGYIRENGNIGIRNDIWIITTVGCVNKVADRLAALTGAVSITHPFGCSQLGDDMKITQLILRGFVNHPNAGGVLVLGLGCENNNINVFKEVLGVYNDKRVKFLNCQESNDEITEGVKFINQLKQYARRFVRTDVPLSKLKIGLKCGGSDGYSGITANPLVGRVSDKLIQMGGTSVLTEVPEMFGAETLLMKRCKNRKIFDKTVALINNFKDYFIKNNQVVYENPSPGNKEGGITTLEEKSLGCVQKGGKSVVCDVLNYGDTLTKNGLNLLNGPGNDIVAITNLTACGAHMILFTTGRGTPLGANIPTLKIATNSVVAENKKNWIDFNAGTLIEGMDFETASEKLLDMIVDVANGKETKNEINGYKEISIFKDGITL